jgi:4-amino-4-deoxy-L-arabinose transferase-like glycosyltransferase
VTAALSPKRLALGLVGLVALAFGLRAVHLAAQPLNDDDRLVAVTAQFFTQFGWPEPTMWNHPRLRDLFVALSLDALGPTAWGIKLSSVVLGTLSVAATAVLLYWLSGSAAAAFVAGLLVAIDPLHLDFSRQGINDVYLAFFPVAAIAAAWRYRSTRHPPWLLLTGVLLGLGLASKWGAAFPVAVVAALVLFDAVRGPAPARERAVEATFVVACLVVLPATLYLLTYLPWFSRGYSLPDWVRFQLTMGHETATHTGYGVPRPAGFPGEVVGAWRWFLQPVYYVDVIVRPGAQTFLTGIGNPVAWLAVWPAFGYAVFRAVKHADRTALLLTLLFAASYLPFLVVPRPIWTNSALSVLPFAMLLVGYGAAQLRMRWPGLVAGYLVLAMAGGAVFWLPAMGLRPAFTEGFVHALVPQAAFEQRLAR